MKDNYLINTEKFNRNKTIAWVEIIGGALFSVYIVGIPFLIWGLRRRKLAKKCERYAGVLLADPNRRISSIASSTGDSYAEVVKTLGEINQKGLFADCCVNERTDVVSFVDDPGCSQRFSDGVAVVSPGTPFVPIVCPNCNGTTKLPAGTVAECEYCGSPLEAPKLENACETTAQPAESQDKPVAKREKGIGDITLGEAAAAGAAVIGAISIFKD